MIYFCIVIIMISSGSIGYILAQKYNNRVVFYNNAVKFADFLKLNIFYMRENIGEIINKFVQDGDNKYLHKYLEVKKLLLENTISVDELNKLNMCSDLTSNETIEFVGFLNKLGKSNLESQVQIIDSYKVVFENRLSECKKAQSQKGKICFKVAVFVGAIISILII